LLKKRGFPPVVEEKCTAKISAICQKIMGVMGDMGG
jgi:hypothetical protein